MWNTAKQACTIKVMYVLCNFTVLSKTPQVEKAVNSIFPNNWYIDFHLLGAIPENDVSNVLLYNIRIIWFAENRKLYCFFEDHSPLLSITEIFFVANLLKIPFLPGEFQMSFFPLLRENGLFL